jgi:hypothetical protein
MANDLPDYIVFSNNRSEGHGRMTKELHVTNLISEFLRENDPKGYVPERQILRFLAEYRTHEGLAHYAPFRDEEIRALKEEYKAQVEPEAA